MLGGLFDALKHDESRENDYVMKGTLILIKVLILWLVPYAAILRVVIVGEVAIAPFAGHIIQEVIIALLL